MKLNKMEDLSKAPLHIAPADLHLRDSEPARQPLSDAWFDPVATYATLFEGRRSSHGVSMGSQARTEQTEVTLDQYRRHLNGDGTDGQWSLGLNPLRDDNTVVFAALDFDAKALSTIEV